MNKITDPYYIRPSKKQLKYWKEHYKTKSSQEYYNEISESIKQTLDFLSICMNPLLKR